MPPPRSIQCPRRTLSQDFTIGREAKKFPSPSLEPLFVPEKAMEDTWDPQGPIHRKRTVLQPQPLKVLQLKLFQYPFLPPFTPQVIKMTQNELHLLELQKLIQVR